MRRRPAAKAGRLDDARRAYERAASLSPDSAFLYRELGQVEKRAGQCRSGARSICAVRSSSTPTTRLHWSRRESCWRREDDAAGAEDAYRKGCGDRSEPESARGESRRRESVLANRACRAEFRAVARDSATDTRRSRRTDRRASRGA